MPHEGLALQVEVEVISLMLVALGVYVISKRIRIPYTIALVLTGIAISLLGPASLGELFPVQLDSDLILLVFLPGLIFEAAYSLSLQELRDNFRLIMLLAVPGMLLATGIVGGVLHVVLGIDFEVALLFGALISATDPVSVLALFRELRVPKRLSILMEGESLFNDGTAVVIFFLLLDVVQGHQVTLAQGVQEFIIVVAGGALTGYMLGLAATELLGWKYVVDDHAIQIALTLVLAYGTFLLAEEVLHVSPVIAVVVAGITLGTRQRDEGGEQITVKISVDDFWELVAFLINSAIFLLIGLESPLPLVGQNLGPIAIAIVTVIGARAVVVFATGFYSRRLTETPIPRRWDPVMFWGGLRGSVSLALALSLPLDFVHRELVLGLTLGYVIFSLVVGGLTMKPLLARLGLTSRSQTREQWEQLLARLRMLSATQQTVERLSREHLLPPQMDESLRDAARRTFEASWTEVERLLLTDPDLARERTEYVLTEIVRDRRNALGELERRGFIAESTYEHELDTLIRQVQEALEAESTEQVSLILAGLVGRWDRVRDVRHLLRQSPDMSQQLVRTALARAACETMEELMQSRQIIEPFVAQEFRLYIEDLRQHTDEDMREAINQNPQVRFRVARMVLDELLTSQRQALARLFRNGLMTEAEHTALRRRLDEIEQAASTVDDAHTLNALLLAVPGMIRGLGESDNAQDTAEPAGG